MLFDEALTGSLFDTLLWCLTPKGRLFSPFRCLCDPVVFQLVDDLLVLGLHPGMQSGLTTYF